ncbi:hypothetical protein ACOMHN_040845 [Nucella lapillus]
MPECQQTTKVETGNAPWATKQRTGSSVPRENRKMAFGLREDRENARRCFARTGEIFEKLRSEGKRERLRRRGGGDEGEGNGCPGSVGQSTKRE